MKNKNSLSTFILSISIILSLFIFMCGEESRVKIKEDTETIKNLDEKENTVGKNESENTSEVVTDKSRKTKDLISIGVLPEYSPYEYITEDGEFKGFDVDIVKAIMNEMGMKYELKKIEWGQALIDMKAGKLDLLLDCIITEERKKFMNFPDSHMSYDWVIFTHKDNEDIDGNTKKETIESLFGKDVIITQGYASIEILRPYNEINLITTPYDKECFNKVANKEVDATPNDKLVGLYHTKKHNLPLKTVGKPIEATPYATAITKHLGEDFVKEYNKALKTIKDNGIFDKIYNKWFK
ncbi:MAG: substrate-binding periplasmic protein [Spirochaetota bacterium]